jgi:hypothetical protein
VLQNQKALFRLWKGRGLPKDEAIQNALRDYTREERGMHFMDPPPTNTQVDKKITRAQVNRLANVIDGKNGSANRMKSRRTKASAQVSRKT